MVWVTGIGRTLMGRSDLTDQSLQQAAVAAALADAGIEAADVGAVIGLAARSLNNRSGVEALCDSIGMIPKAAETIEAGGTSAILALMHAVQYVQAGFVDHVLCFGGYRFLSWTRGQGTIQDTLVTDGPVHPELEAAQGATIVSLYAELARRWRDDARQAGATGDLADLAALVRSNAAGNPLAKHRELVTGDDVRRSRVIADPLHKLECASPADGAAALVVSRAPRPGAAAIRAFGLAGDAYYRARAGRDPRELAAEAFGQLRLDRIDAAFLYDSFSVTLALQIEVLGLAAPGCAADAFCCTDTDSRPVLNPHGGLLADGQPGIAGSLLSVVAATDWLRDEGTDDSVPTAVVSGLSGIFGRVGAVALSAE